MRVLSSRNSLYSRSTNWFCHWIVHWWDRSLSKAALAVTLLWALSLYLLRRLGLKAFSHVWVQPVSHSHYWILYSYRVYRARATFSVLFSTVNFSLPSSCTLSSFSSPTFLSHTTLFPLQAPAFLQWSIYKSPTTDSHDGAWIEDIIYAKPHTQLYLQVITHSLHITCHPGGEGHRGKTQTSWSQKGWLLCHRFRKVTINNKPTLQCWQTCKRYHKL